MRNGDIHVRGCPAYLEDAEVRLMRERRVCNGLRRAIKVTNLAKSQPRQERGQQVAVAVMRIGAARAGVESLMGPGTASNAIRYSRERLLIAGKSSSPKKWLFGAKKIRLIEAKPTPLIFLADPFFRSLEPHFLAIPNGVLDFRGPEINPPTSSSGTLCFSIPQRARFPGSGNHSADLLFRNLIF